jgi:hypothetical protein
MDIAFSELFRKNGDIRFIVRKNKEFIDKEFVLSGVDYVLYAPHRNPLRASHADLE